MTEARYLPEHATTVAAEQSACLAALSLGRPMLSVDQPEVDQLDKDLAAPVRVEIGFRKGVAEIGGRAIVRAAVTKGQEQELLIGGEASLVPCPGDSGESHRGHPGRPSRVWKGAIPLTARSPCLPTDRRAIEAMLAELSPSGSASYAARRKRSRTLWPGSAPSARKPRTRS
jgi:hypothetical protein